MLQWLAEIDTQLFLFLNGINAPIADPVMVRISGNLVWVPFYLAIVYLLFRNYGIKGLWFLLGSALVVALADQASVHLFKNVFERLRPCHNPDLSELVHTVGRCGGKFGFVSSHAANTFGVATFLHFVISKRWFSAAIFAWAAVVAYSRIYLGVHYPADVLGGALLGVAIGKLVQFVYLAASNRVDLLPDIRNLRKK